MSASAEHALADALAQLAQRPDALEVIQKIQATLQIDSVKEERPNSVVSVAGEQPTNADMENAHAVSAATVTSKVCTKTQDAAHSDAQAEVTVSTLADARGKGTTAIAVPSSATTKISQVETSVNTLTAVNTLIAAEVDTATAPRASHDVASTTVPATQVDTSAGTVCPSAEIPTISTTPPGEVPTTITAPQVEVVPAIITAPQIIEAPSHVAHTPVTNPRLETATVARVAASATPATLVDETAALAIAMKPAAVGGVSSSQEHIAVTKSTHAENTITRAASSTTQAPTTPCAQVNRETTEQIIPSNASPPQAPVVTLQSARSRIYGPTTTSAYLAATAPVYTSRDAVLTPMMSSAQILCDQADYLIRALTSAKDALRAQLALFPVSEATQTITNTENAMVKTTAKEEATGQKGKTTGKGKGKKGEKRPLSACGAAIHRSKHNVTKRMRGLQHRCSRFLSVIGKEDEKDSDSSSSSSSDDMLTKDDKEVYLAKRRARFPNGAQEKKETEDNNELEFD
eukprot:GEMP01033791.1.p1 GENE.GEMP01033791.1~~GEMP01033791.1.p1  ORF type:complete len:517 (+),score=119.87 GEMP01033791.1:43-1593(+)